MYGFPVRQLVIAGLLCPLSSALWAPPGTRAWASTASGIPQSSSPQESPEQAPEPSTLGPPAISIPRLTRGPSIDDFSTMKPAGEVAPQMTKVTGFVQRDPHDGEGVSQRTEAYLGYDDKNLVCRVRVL